jgi:phosphatidate cytidylyltransferase
MLAINEFFGIINASKKYLIKIPTLLFAVLMLLFNNEFLHLICLYSYIGIIFGLMIKSLKYKTIAEIFTATILIVYSFEKLICIRGLSDKYGVFYVLLVLAVAWMADTGAYFCGKFFGKNKLCPNVSPKKTVEGFFGGIIVSIISVLLIAMIFNNFIFHEKQKINYLLITIFGLIGSLISAFGDLCFSIIKRNFHVKDFGNAIPGHGGILDRFDSVIFVAPYAYLFLKYFQIILYSA